MAKPWESIRMTIAVGNFEQEEDSGSSYFVPSAMQKHDITFLLKPTLDRGKLRAELMVMVDNLEKQLAFTQ